MDDLQDLVENPAATIPDASVIEGPTPLFPPTGPYSCEICELVTQTKSEFVNHVKEQHLDLNENILRSLEVEAAEEIQLEEVPQDVPRIPEVLMVPELPVEEVLFYIMEN